VTIDYDVNAPDLGTAIALATRRAINDGYSHVSVMSTKQTKQTGWTIRMFCSS
jgi:hypothetical protein